jgi:cation diffusion facilitator family transporter
MRDLTPPESAAARDRHPACVVHHADFAPLDGTGERALHRVIWLTAVTMVVEIAGGLVFGSLALLADGWHMGTHVAALGIAALVMRYARRVAGDPRFAWGIAKLSPLGGFASSVLLATVSLLMMLEAVTRLAQPQPIRFNEALWVAALGLAVNLASAVLLARRDEPHHHGTQAHHHHDHNLRAAYLHVIADALTSVAAIVALTAGKWLGWLWLDPLMAMVGGTIILRWAWGLARDSARVLMDADVPSEAVLDVRRLLEGGGDTRVLDLHVWRLAPGKLGVIATLEAAPGLDAADYRARLEPLGCIAHATIEAHRPAGQDQPAAVH